MKAIIFDSGTLINLSINGLLPMLSELKKIFDGKFLITNTVKYEVIDRPSGIQRFELGALRINQMLEDGILELPSSLNISEESIEQTTNMLMDIANHFLQAREKWVQIVSEGEISCLALSEWLSRMGIENIIALDERTTRLLCENPSMLEKTMSEKLHQPVRLVVRDMNVFSKFRFIRSSELVFVAYKKGLVDLNSDKTLEALLYATKFNGAAISFDEIKLLKKI
jgi:hypothetical protein